MKKRLLKSALALLAGAWAMGGYAQSVGDIFTYDGHKYKVTGENLITNGSFENGFTGWTSANDFTSELSSGNFTLKTEGAQDGSQYLVGTKNDGSGGAGSIGTAWPIEGGKTYVYSYWLKSEKGGTGTNYLVNSLTNKAGDETKRLADPKVASDGSWCENKIVFENTSNYAFCQVKYRWLAGNWGFDNFVLAEVIEMPNTEGLESTIAEAESFYSPEAEGASALQSAIETAKGYLISESVDEVNAATAALKEAIWAYQIANASTKNPVEMSFPDTWQNIGNPYNCGGITMHEKYAEQPYTGDVMWQTTTDLPNGIYEAEIYCVASACEWNFTSTITDGAEGLTNIYGNGKYALTVPVVKQKSASTAGVYKIQCAVSDGTLNIAIKNDAEGANWILVANKSLTYLGFDNSAAIAALEALIEEASAQCMEESENGTSLSSLVEELYAKIEAAQSAVTVATKTALETATQELREAMNAAKAAEAPLAALKAAYALNSNLMDNSTPNNLETMEQYQGAIANAQMAQWTATTVEELEAAIEQLEAARQAYVLTAYPYAEEGQAPAVTFDLTFKMANAAVTSAQGWNGGRTNAGEQYTGAPDNTYLDAWNATFNMSQVVTGLPNGVYELKAATRADASTATANIYALVDGVNYSTDVHRVGNTGNDLGNGWGWTTVGDIIVGSGTVTIGFYSECGGNKWAGADNFQLSLVRALTEEEIFASAQKELAAKLEAAKAINLEANVGDKAFQKSLDNKEYLEQVVAMAEQQSQLGIGETSTELIQQTIAMLANAVEGFEVLNQPAEGDVFNVIIRTGDNYKFKDVPLTFREDGKAGAYFKPGFSSANYAQSVIFTATDETNVYTMSTVFADGVRRYISTGVTSGNGSNNIQIRLTDDAEKALKVKVAATNEDGIYTLYNTEANQLVGCQDGDDKAEGGLYTTSSHSNLALVQVEKPSVKLNITDAGFATLMLPFAAEVPAGVTVYACDAAGEEQNGVQVLTLTQVETIAANTPYIVEGAAGTEATFIGFGAAYQNEYAAGWLTGTFAEKTAAAGTYVLQNQAENGVGFYAVTEGAEPVIGAYRAWLAPTAEETAGVKVFILGNLATGIEGVTAAADAQVNVYTLNGVLVRQNVKMSEALKGLNKGVYIVNGVKQAVK